MTTDKNVNYKVIDHIDNRNFFMDIVNIRDSLKNFNSKFKNVKI
jgi:hypothetical protein